MSTTTGLDLLERAERLTLELTHCDLPVSTATWESFDTTAYRLLREVIGPSRSDSGGSGRTRARLLQVIHSYPTPLRPPLDTLLTVTAAARFAPGSVTLFRGHVARGEIETRPAGDASVIESRVLDRRPDIAPANATDPHPLARLSTTLGALADMVSQERRIPQTPGGLDDASAVDVTLRVLGFASVAARYTLRFGLVADGNRPLLVAQYAERAADILSLAAHRAPPLAGLVARVESPGNGLNERLDNAAQHWAEACQAELSRAIPATQVMANIADLSAMMFATTHHLHGLRPDVAASQRQQLTAELRAAANALQAAAKAWKGVTTLQPQSHGFGSASLELFKCLREVMTVGRSPVSKPGHDLNLDEATRVVTLAFQDVRRFVSLGQEITHACLSAGVLFAPRGTLARTSVERGAQSSREGLVAMSREDGAALLEPVDSLAFAVQPLALSLPREHPVVSRLP